MERSLLVFLYILFTAIDAMAQTPKTVRYEYDALNRLKEVTYPNGSKITYHYDELGNRTSVVTSACQLPTATLSGTQAITAGQSATLSVALTGEAPWSVTVNGVPYSGIASSPFQLSVTPGGTTTYTLSAVSTACGAGTVSGQAVVTVNVPPTPVIAAGGPTTFCAGGSVSLSAGSFSAYVWKKDNVQVGTNATFSATESGSYTVTITDGNGLQGTSPPVGVTVNALPTVSLSALAASYCQNASALTPGTPAGGSYKIDGGPAVSNFNPASLSVGNRSVVYTFTDANGCTNSATRSVGIIQPVFTQTASVSGAPVCAGQAVTLSFGVNCPANATFTAQLSDAGGGFASPVDLGAISPGQNQVVIPPNTLFGTGYRLRVVGTNPALTSMSEAFRINTLGQISVALYPSTPSRTCLGDDLPVTFSTTGPCPFPLDNIFTVQLSNAAGSFAAPLLLGTTTPGTTVFPGSLLANLPVGTGYRVRILSSNPAQTSQSSAPFELRAPSLSVTPGVGGVPQGGLCRGEQVTVSFNLPVGSCAFPAGNGFTAQLSNTTGGFGSPLSLGAVQAGISNPVTIPATVAAGTSYRIRIVSSSPALTSSSSIPFRVNACASRLSAEEPALVVAPNPVKGGDIRCRVRGMDQPRLSLTTSTGKNVAFGQKTDDTGEYILTPKQALPGGVYILKASEGQLRLSARVVVAE